MGIRAAPPRTGPRTARALRSVVRWHHGGLNELGSKLRIGFVVAAPERRQRPRVRLSHSSHLRAQVHRVQVHRYTMRLQDADQLIGDLDPNTFLDREASSEDAHEPGQFGDADDLFVRDVADVRVSAEWKRVMLA